MPTLTVGKMEVVSKQLPIFNTNMKFLLFVNSYQRRLTPFRVDTHVLLLLYRVVAYGRYLAVSRFTFNFIK